MTLPNNDTPKPDDNAIDVTDSDAVVEDAQESDVQDSDIQEGDVEYADAEILPPIKVEPKKGLGFKSLLTATIFAGLLGAGGGFGLSYSLLPKLSPTPDTSRLETKISTLSQNHQAVSTQIDRLEQSVRDVSRQAEMAGLTDRSDIETRLDALETQKRESAIETVNPATFMYGNRLLRDILQEILENQIALQSMVQESAVETTSEMTSEIAGETFMTPNTPAQSDTAKTNKVTTSDDNKASSSKSVIGSMTMDGKTKDGKAKDEGAGAMNTKPAGSVKSDVVARTDGTFDTGTPDYIKSRPDSNTTNGMNTDAINMGGTLETVQDRIITTQAEETISSENISENVTVRSTLVLPEFPEDALRAAVRENELAGKSWFARIIGKNLSIKKAGERDAIDDIVDLIAQKDIAGALDKMETLPSSVRSVARDWMKAARQVR